jgi:hypothetical protein
MRSRVSGHNESPFGSTLADPIDATSTSVAKSSAVRDTPHWAGSRTGCPEQVLADAVALNERSPKGLGTFRRSAPTALCRASAPLAKTPEAGRARSAEPASPLRRANRRRVSPPEAAAAAGAQRLPRHERAGSTARCGTVSGCEIGGMVTRGEWWRSSRRGVHALP